jgi:protein polybromo-1
MIITPQYVFNFIFIGAFFYLQGRYRRMDRFQDDMFKVFELARKVSRTDSQVRVTLILT